MAAFWKKQSWSLTCWWCLALGLHLTTSTYVECWSLHLFLIKFSFTSISLPALLLFIAHESNCSCHCVKGWFAEWVELKFILCFLECMFFFLPWQPCGTRRHFIFENCLQHILIRSGDINVTSSLFRFAEGTIVLNQKKGLLLLSLHAEYEPEAAQCRHRRREKQQCSHLKPFSNL